MRACLYVLGWACSGGNCGFMLEVAAARARLALWRDWWVLPCREPTAFSRQRAGRPRGHPRSRPRAAFRVAVLAGTARCGRAREASTSKRMSGCDASEVLKLHHGL